MMNRYLFLDIDGVLNSERSVFAYKKLVHAGFVKHNLLLGRGANSYFDPLAVSLLRLAQENLKFKIVISSSWRYTLSISDFVEMFKEYDWDTSEIIIGKTGTEQVIRGQQIKSWLNNHAKYPYQYVILDDSDDMLEEQKDNFVKTSIEEGLSFNNFTKMFAIFGESHYNSLNPSWNSENVP